MRKLRITIENKSYEVTVEDLTEEDLYRPSPGPSQPNLAPAQSPTTISAEPKPQLPVDAGAVTSPMAGAIMAVLVKPGDQVKERQPLVVLEAMKMENQITAPVTGNVKSIDVNVGDSVQEGQVLLVLE